MEYEETVLAEILQTLREIKNILVSGYSAEQQEFHKPLDCVLKCPVCHEDTSWNFPCKNEKCPMGLFK